MLTTYGYGLMIVAGLPWLASVKAPAPWVTISEVVSAVVLQGVAILASPTVE
jgi:hypothetical protein